MGKKVKDTQHSRIIEYMKKHGSITTLDAFRDLGITKLTTRISEMRSMGISIEGKREAVKNRFEETCYINRYTFPKEDKAV